MKISASPIKVQFQFIFIFVLALMGVFQPVAAHALNKCITFYTQQKELQILDKTELNDLIDSLKYNNQIKYTGSFYLFLRNHGKVLIDPALNTSFLLDFPSDPTESTTIKVKSISDFSRQFDEIFLSYWKGVESKFKEAIKDIDPILQPIAMNTLIHINSGNIEERLKPLRQLIRKGLHVFVNPLLAPGEIVFHRNYGLGKQLPTVETSSIEALKKDSIIYEQLYRWTEINNEKEQLYKEVEERLQKTPNSQGLLEAHRRFINEGGILYFKDVNPYFKSPNRPLDVPTIVLQNWEDLTNGAYKHELTHFRDWLFVKQKLIQNGLHELDAHTALDRYRQSPEKEAKVAQWLEAHATENWNVYPEFEAIRLLSRDWNFEDKLKDSHSQLNQQVTNYLFIAMEKVINKHKPLDEEVSYSWIYEDLKKLASEGITDDTVLNKSTWRLKGKIQANIKGLIENDSYILDLKDLFDKDLINRLDPQDWTAIYKFSKNPKIKTQIKILLKKKQIAQKAKFRERLLRDGIPINIVDLTLK